MKKSMPMIFILFTLTIIICTGLYTWYTNNKHAATIAHISDPEWSKSFNLSSDVQSAIYDFGLDTNGNIHTAWIKYNHFSGIEALMYSVTDSSGKSIIPARQLTQKEDMSDLALLVKNDLIHIFWVGSDTPLETNLDLYYIKMDFSGQIIAEEKLLSNEFSDIHDLSAVFANEDFLLVWTDQVGNSKQVKTLHLDVNCHLIGTPVQITNSAYHSIKPTIISNSGQHHLAWLEESNTFNNYQLFYQQLNNTGQPTGHPIPVSVVNREENDNPIALGVQNGKAYIIWTKIMYSVGPINSESNIEKTFLNYELFGGVIDTTTNQVTLIQRLTELNGVSYDPSVVIDANGLIHLTYVDTYVNHLSLTHKIYQNDFKTLVKNARRLYPDQTYALMPKMLLEPGKGIHTVWLESSNKEISLFYANTLKPHKPSFFEVIGLNTGYFGFSFFLSILYLFTAPLFIMFFHMGMISIYSIIFFGFLQLVKNFKLNSFFTNRYIIVTILCITHYLVYFKLDKLTAFFWPSVPTFAQLPVIFTIASIVTIAFIYLNKFEDDNIIQAGIIAIIWAYWLNIANLCMNLQYLNFFS